MKILIIKTSSLGDIVHTFAALSEAKIAYPDAQFDWLVDESFVNFVKLHPDVQKVIPVSIRKLSKIKSILKIKNFISQWKDIKNKINSSNYDLVIDAQGLIKSAIISSFVNKAKRIGFNSKSIRREKLASLFYHSKYDVPLSLHATERIRSLFAQALGYTTTRRLPDVNLITDKKTLNKIRSKPYIVLIIGSAWKTKEYPVPLWRKLSFLAQKAGFQVFVPWFSIQEKVRSIRLSNFGTKIFPAADTNGLVSLLANAKVVVGADTGLTHLANTLGVPTVGIYSASNVALTGLRGKKATSISAQFTCSPCLRRICKFSSTGYPPCFNTMNPSQIWEDMQTYLPSLEPLDLSEIEQIENNERTGLSQTISDKDLIGMNIPPDTEVRTYNS